MPTRTRSHVVRYLYEVSELFGIDGRSDSNSTSPTHAHVYVLNTCELFASAQRHGRRKHAAECVLLMFVLESSLCAQNAKTKKLPSQTNV